MKEIRCTSLYFINDDINEFFKKLSPKERSRFLEEAFIHYALTIGKNTVERRLGRQLQVERSTPIKPKKTKTAKPKASAKVKPNADTKNTSATQSKKTEAEDNGYISPVVMALLGNKLGRN